MAVPYIKAFYVMITSTVNDNRRYSLEGKHKGNDLCPRPLHSKQMAKVCIKGQVQHTAYYMRDIVLKTLFKTHCGGSIKKKLNFDICGVWWCSDGSVNSQEYKSFKLYMYAVTEYVKLVNLSIFTSLKHLMMLLKCNFFRASFLQLIKDTDSM